MSRKTIIILSCALGLVAVLVLLAATGWGGAMFEQFPNPQFVIAFAIGATLTMLLAVGLFALVFISSRRGFDDNVDNRIGDPERDDPQGDDR